MSDWPINPAELTPQRIVDELDRHVVSQDEAKRAVAIAVRNRWRRMEASPELRDDITPKNLLLIGPTGVGKTEIARRLAKLVAAPFIKVEATKFTEVGYVGRDVESIIRDLADAAHAMVRNEERERCRSAAEQRAEERILDALLFEGDRMRSPTTHPASATREKLRTLLRAKSLEDKSVEIEAYRASQPPIDILGPQGFSEVEGQLKEMLSNVIPRGKERRTVTVADARRIFLDEAYESLLNTERVSSLAVSRAEQQGIVFLDEIDKICSGSAERRGADVSREGVQRDLLPIVEGSTVTTKHGLVRTEHVLFIASGAFHQAKPSDLMPEFQGRFPIRVELKSLSAEHFVRILTEPASALIKQYQALLAVEGVGLQFDRSAVEEIARLTTEVNARTEDIGARRLHTLLERVLADVSFRADTMKGTTVTVDSDYVKAQLRDIVADEDLSRFIL